VVERVVLEEQWVVIEGYGAGHGVRVSGHARLRQPTLSALRSGVE
jgi:hypothetical protein